MLLRILGVLILTIAAVGVLFVIAMRTKNPTLQAGIKGMNKRLWNPMSMKDAGTADGKYSVIRHVGRTSGKAYETPVAMYLDGDSIWIVLPYGTNTDWYKNLVAAGGGTAVHKGERYDFTTPEVVPTADALEFLPENEYTSIKTFKVDRVLRLPVLNDTRATAVQEG